MKTILIIISLLTSFSTFAANPIIETSQGEVQGSSLERVNIFLGIPFAAPPVGENRWRAPRPAPVRDTVLIAEQYAPCPMQEHIFGDIEYSPAGISEDCLYLNVWAPEHMDGEKLPVLIYFNGGGLMVGHGSEPRYAGYSLARKGIIVVTANYREGIFGFYSHPELSAETDYNGSGNYGFMDMVAAIEWVKDNISQFGGNPDRITVAGESAGSISVSALMASPLCRGLFSQAIGSSGSTFIFNELPTARQAEQAGLEKAMQMGCSSLAELRALSADSLMLLADVHGMTHYPVDGNFLDRQPAQVYAAGEQMNIPLLAGGNSHEMLQDYLLRGGPATLQTLRENLTDMYGENTDRVLELYGIKSDADVNGDGAIQLASDTFIGYSTWKWAQAHAAAGTAPVYRYIYSHSRPWRRGAEEKVPEAGGALHAADIEYAMGNLDTNTTFDWQPEDYAISEIFSDIYVNFVKTGNPATEATGAWPAINGAEFPAVLLLNAEPSIDINPSIQERYNYLDSIMTNTHSRP